MEPLRWNYYALRIGNFLIRYEYGIVWMLNPDICIFFRWRNKIQSSYWLWILFLRLQPRSQVSLALNAALLLPVFTKHAVTNIPRGVLGTRVNLDTWEGANSIWKWIRVDVEIFESGKKQLWIQKYPGTCGGGLNERFDGLPSSELLLSGIQAHDQAPQRAYISAKCTNDTYVKTRPKRMAAIIFRDTLRRTVFTRFSA